jgi:hypothetical protein
VWLLGRFMYNETSYEGLENCVHENWLDVEEEYAGKSGEGSLPLWPLFVSLVLVFLAGWDVSREEQRVNKVWVGCISLDVSSLGK